MSNNNQDNTKQSRWDWQPHVHDLQKYPFVKPTCMKDGNVTYWQCKKCAARYLDEEATEHVVDRDDVIIKSCHTLSYNKEIVATCTSDGRIAHWHCAVCGLNFKDFKCYDFVREKDLVVPRLGHKLVYHAAKTSDCISQGNVEYWQCEHCGNYYLDENGNAPTTWQQLQLPLLQHRLDLVEGVEPTCCQEGNISHCKCNRCGNLFADKDASTPLGPQEVVLPKLSHTKGKYQYFDKDNHAEVCSQCGNLLDIAKHTYKDGKCTVCGYDKSTDSDYQLTPDILTDTLILISVVNQRQNAYIPSMIEGNIIGVVGTQAFCGNNVLQRVTFGSGTVYIDGQAFKDCTVLSKVQLPYTLKMIGEQAFCNCKRLAAVTIPRGVFHIESDAFCGCSGIETIAVEQGNTVYESNGSCLVDKDYKCLVFGTSAAVIPTDGSVLSVGEYAFCDNDRLVEISLPDSIVKLSKYAFANCTQLTTVSFGANIKTIANNCFENAISLATVDLSDSMSEIGAKAFCGCNSLNSVVIGSMLNGIGQKAFWHCDSLKSIFYKGNLTQWNAIDLCCDALPDNTVVYCYSDNQPLNKGHYWHYVDGQPVVW